MRSFWTLLAILSIFSCQNHDYAPEPEYQGKYKMPEQIYGNFFKEIQMFEVVSNKDFADAIPKREPQDIYNDFRRAKNDLDFDLKTFLDENFILPDRAVVFPFDSSRNISASIDMIWKDLKRSADKATTSPYDSRIPLPNPYLVLWHGADDVAYWDSYFAMLGMEARGEVEMIENTVDNFAHLIKTVGFIPHTNRTYNTSRSNLPVFMDMVKLLADAKNDDQVYVTYLPALEKEYQYWMNGADELSDDNRAFTKVVKVPGGVLNRFYDSYTAPRTEKYRNDVRLDNDNDWRAGWQTMREIRTADETGWNFSSRYLRRGNRYSTAIATEIVPVDLNCALYQMEKVLSKAYGLAGKDDKEEEFKGKREARKNLILDLLYTEQENIFTDYHWPDSTLSDNYSAATLYPLYYEIVSQETADTLVEFVKESLIDKYGIKTTMDDTGQRWDAPNGWAHLQWVTWNALNNYGYHTEAKELAASWIQLIEKGYSVRGCFDSHYIVTEQNLDPEWPKQNFAWTLGVYLALKSELE